MVFHSTVQEEQSFLLLSYGKVPYCLESNSTKQIEFTFLKLLTWKLTPCMIVLSVVADMNGVTIESSGSRTYFVVPYNILGVLKVLQYISYNFTWRLIF